MDSLYNEITVSDQLKKFADRIGEQLSCLNTLLNSTTDRLGSMSTLMKNYSPELVKQIDILRSSLGSYKDKASTIYNELKENLYKYATNLSYNLEDLTNEVNNIRNAIQYLNIES